MSGIIGVSPDMRSGVVGKYPTDHVIQTIYSSGGQDNLTIDGGWHDTNLDATITLSSPSNKVLVMVQHTGLYVSGSGAIQVRLNKLVASTTTNLIKFEGEGAYTGDTSAVIVGGTGTNYIDTPATSSAIKYFTDYNAGSSSNIASLQRSGGVATIVLIEIVG